MSLKVKDSVSDIKVIAEFERRTVQCPSGYYPLRIEALQQGLPGSTSNWRIAIKGKVLYLIESRKILW